ncbi:DUF262 domain-containing protein [Halobacillus litoralis]|uniref:DUF262 domain-containing protein n=1 Tax=Halobacillus litoralis TaxID=45668 RepID=UPI00136D7716|nr:DUF262 domain-containing protein [Halobacillus litoralis]MYL39217.1 DUF262 domain-containing protein [Halobacillus litoralis]
MKITPTTLTINQLLGSSNEQFIIPAYQRRYSWGEKQWADLFNDIKLLNQEDSHLLGNILCLTSNYSVGINELELVDGQQRATTLTIIIKALADMFKNFGIDEVHNELEVLLTCKGIDRKQKRKLILGDLDDIDYMRFLNNDELDKVENENLVEAYKFFLNEFSSFSVENLYEYVHKLRSNTYVIRLDVANAKDAYKLFETINNRGLRLSSTDIIKNFLLGHASLINEKTLEKVKSYWTEIIINLDGTKTDDFFRHYLSYATQKRITKSTIISEFKNYYFNSVIEAESLNEYSEYSGLEESTDEDVVHENINFEGQKDIDQSTVNKVSITEFAKRLKDSSTIYKMIRNGSFEVKDYNKHLINLKRIKSFPSYIFLIDLFQRNIEKNDRIKILKLIETFMLRRHICEYRTGELDTIFSNLVNLKDIQIVNEVKSRLFRYLPGDNEFEEKFARHSFRNNEGRAKYVLEQLEYNLINDQGEYELTSGIDLHLEHIIPQKITTKKSKKDFGDWEGYLGGNSSGEHREYVNRIGNLTLLARSLNISASNNPFQSKVKEYKKSNIALTQEVSKFDDFKFEDVINRSKILANSALELWNFN